MPGRRQRTSLPQPNYGPVRSPDQHPPTPPIDAVTPNEDFDCPALTGPNTSDVTFDAGKPAIEFNGDGSINSCSGLDEAAANDPKSQVKIGWANGA